MEIFGQILDVWYVFSARHKELQYERNIQKLTIYDTTAAKFRLDYKPPGKSYDLTLTLIVSRLKHY